MNIDSSLFWRRSERKFGPVVSAAIAIVALAMISIDLAVGVGTSRFFAANHDTLSDLIKDIGFVAQGLIFYHAFGWLIAVGAMAIAVPTAVIWTSKAPPRFALGVLAVLVVASLSLCLRAAKRDYVVNDLQLRSLLDPEVQKLQSTVWWIGDKSFLVPTDWIPAQTNRCGSQSTPGCADTLNFVVSWPDLKPLGSTEMLRRVDGAGTAISIGLMSGGDVHALKRRYEFNLAYPKSVVANLYGVEFRHVADDGARRAVGYVGTGDDLREIECAIVGGTVGGTCILVRDWHGTVSLTTRFSASLLQEWRTLDASQDTLLDAMSSRAGQVAQVK